MTDKLVVVWLIGFVVISGVCTLFFSEHTLNVVGIAFGLSGIAYGIAVLVRDLLRLRTSSNEEKRLAKDEEDCATR